LLFRQKEKLRAKAGLQETEKGTKKIRNAKTRKEKAREESWMKEGREIKTPATRPNRLE